MLGLSAYQLRFAIAQTKSCHVFNALRWILANRRNVSASAFVPVCRSIEVLIPPCLQPRSDRRQEQASIKPTWQTFVPVVLEDGQRQRKPAGLCSRINVNTKNKWNRRLRLQAKKDSASIQVPRWSSFSFSRNPQVLTNPPWLSTTGLCSPAVMVTA